MWFDYESGMKYLKKGENVIYRGEIMNGVPNGHGYVIDRNEVIVGGDWESGILTLSDSQYIELENGEFYMNELQSSGLFGCSHNWIHYSLSENGMEKTIHRIIRKEEEWTSILPITVNSICVATNCCNEMKECIEISDYPYLKSLVVKKDSLKYVKSLKVSDNPMLKSIWIGGGYTSGAFYYTTSVSLSSLMIYD